MLRFKICSTFFVTILGAVFGHHHSAIISAVPEDKPQERIFVDLSRPTVVLRDNVSFWLYTATNHAGEGARIYINKTDTLKEFSPKKPTTILVHGYTDSHDGDFIQSMIAMYFNNSYDFNIIAVDYGVIAKGPLYNVAKDNALLVGPYVGELVNFLVREGAALSNIHLIGHSLGGQIVGMAGSNVAGRQSVARITGLDPAMPLFVTESLGHRLDATDADLVDVIHSDGGAAGFLVPVGDIDFYPNGGRPPQPGCPFDSQDSCSHSRSYQWYAKSIANNTMYPARKCANLGAALTGFCGKQFTGFMGENLGKTAKGIYYLRTKD